METSTRSTPCSPIRAPRIPTSWSSVATRCRPLRARNARPPGPYEGDGAARWLWLADGEPELRRTAYDAARAGARILEAGWPDERSVGAALVDPVEPATVTRIFEYLPRG